MKKTRSTPKPGPVNRAKQPAGSAPGRSAKLAAGLALTPRASKKSPPAPRAGTAARAAGKGARAVAGQAARLAAGPAPAPARRKKAPPGPLLPADQRLLQLLELACAVVRDKKGYGLQRFDLRSLNAFTDFLLIATGDSTTQNRAIADGIEERLRTDCGVRPLGVEGAQSGEWVLIDYGGLVINLFTPAVREHFSLERLWADAAPLTGRESA